MTRGEATGAQLRALWLATGLAFAAGIAIGLALPAVWAADSSVAAGQAYDVDYIERLDAAVGLTSEQRRKVTIVKIQEDRDRRRLFEKFSAEMPDAYLTEHRAIMNRGEQRIRVILTPDQLALYDARAGGTDRVPESRQK